MWGEFLAIFGFCAVLVSSLVGIIILYFFMGRKNGKDTDRIK